MSVPQRPSSAVYRRRRIVAGALTLLVLGGALWGIGWTISVAVRPLPAASVALTTPSPIVGEPAALDTPSGARTALGATGFDGVIAHSGDQGQAPIASITKVVTALVVLAAKPIAAGTDGPTITFTDADVQIRNQVIAQNGSNAAVSAGLTLTERQALTVMLLPSANNYAISLANWAFGSIQEFDVQAANWLSQNHLDNTHIVEPSGLSAQNVSSPSDLVRLGQLAEADPVVAQIVSMASADVPGVGLLDNTNTLLGQSGVIGIKTGTTDEAGSCLLFAANISVGSRQVVLVGIELGGASHATVDSDVRALIASATAAFREVTITTAGEAAAVASTQWGQSSELLAADTSTLLAFGDIPIEVTLSGDAFDSARTGQTVSQLAATTGNQHTQVELTASTAITDPGLWWRMSHVDSLR